jgi:hypothetical protein
VGARRWLRRPESFVERCNAAGLLPYEVRVTDLVSPLATTNVPLIPAEGRAWSMKSLARLGASVAWTTQL